MTDNSQNGQAQNDPQYIPPDDTQGVPVVLSAPDTNDPSKKKAPDDSQLAARWILHNRRVAWGLGNFREYKDGVWEEVDKDSIRKSVKQTIDKARYEGVKSSAALLGSVVELVRVEVAVPSDKWDAATDYLPCHNGTLHIPTKTLHPHDPNHYATSKLAFDYDPTADAPSFMKAMEQIPDAHDFLQEFAGYALTTDVRHEIAVWLQGAPGCGKSTILEGLQAMLGERAGVLGLAEIEKSRFSFSQLPGKTLVVSAEQPDSYIGASHILNALISGEKLKVEEKFQEAYYITPRAKVIWAMNNLPRVNDSNNGIMRRVKVIKFPLLDEAQKDLDLKEKIKQEGAGILNWALMGLERLNKRGKFEIPKGVEDATQEFKERNDIPSIFLNEIGAKIDLLNPHCRTQSQALYDAYRDWCVRNSHKPTSSTKMAEEWKRLGFERKDINGLRYWTGVELPASQGSFFNVP